MNTTDEQRMVETLKKRVEALELELEAKEEELTARFGEIAMLTRSLEEQSQGRQACATRFRAANPFPKRSWLIRLFLRSKQRLPRRAVTCIASSNLFDHDWYLRQYPELKDDRLASDNSALHYLKKGGFEGLNPSPSFDSEWYLNQNPDVRATGVNPLLHYLLHGQVEGRQPMPPAPVARQLKKPSGRLKY